MKAQDKQISQQKLLSLCQKIYPLKIKKRVLDFSPDLFSFAQKNRLAHFFALEYKTLPELIKKHQEYQKKVKNSLKKINSLLKGKKYMIIKTFSSFPHLTSDIDILVNDPKSNKYPIHIENKNFQFIHLENKISWSGAKAISNKFAWQNTKKHQWAGYKFLVPSKKLDCLLRIAHFPFEEAKIRLGELLYIFNQLKDLDWSDLKNEAEFMGWPKTFNKMKVMLEKLHSCLFEKPLNTKPLTFPYPLSFNILAGGVIEKRAWKKIWGARLVIKDRFNSWKQKKIG